MSFYFPPAGSTSRAQHPLATPSVGDIQNVGTDRLQLVLTAVPNARLYEVQTSEVREMEKIVVTTG